MNEENRNEQFPLYPELNERGKQEAVALVDQFKKQMLSAAENAISSLYCDVVPHIESDSWGNYRNAMVDAFMGYSQRAREMAPLDYAKLRRKLLDEHKEELQNDIIADLQSEVKTLREQLRNAYDRRVNPL